MLAVTDITHTVDIYLELKADTASQQQCPAVGVLQQFSAWDHQSTTAVWQHINSITIHSIHLIMIASTQQTQHHNSIFTNH